MPRPFDDAMAALLGVEGGGALPDIDPASHFRRDRAGDAGTARALNAAFLIALTGAGHPSHAAARHFLSATVGRWAPVAAFYAEGVTAVAEEIETHDPDFVRRLETLAGRVPATDPDGLAEETWAVFFPEGTGIRGVHERVAALRRQRTVTLDGSSATRPLTDPGRQLLFTANVLLTVPSPPLGELPSDPDLRRALAAALDEPQRYWYDHPIPLDVKPEHNEILHGLRGLEAAAAFEVERGNLPRDTRLTCVLSVSTTHDGLQPIARRYLEHELARAGGLSHLDVYAFTEADTRRLVERVLVPAAACYHPEEDDAAELLTVVGVDGEYGRHYSFLKAIAALWQVLVDPNTRATFKIDLDQVFPQEALVAETGASAFEHLCSPRWGADGVDSSGRRVHLGMIAGTLVNQRDIGASLFTPDVPYPSGPLHPPEYIFFSPLPQALSTEAEMMTRYTPRGPDGTQEVLERVHVTGGTTGILVQSLRRFRPFTPSFIARAEDQAYALATFPAPDARLTYLHQDGLVMRHDKESFAAEAVEAARVGKLIGDHARILLFSAYARLLTEDVGVLKRLVDPFTGCFISTAPTTVTLLRFALTAASMFGAGKDQDGLDFVMGGASRLRGALRLIDSGEMERRLVEERRGWDLYYDTLASLEEGIRRGDAEALALKAEAVRLVGAASVRAAPR